MLTTSRLPGKLMDMTTMTERTTGRRYQLWKIFAAPAQPARFMEASTGRRYNVVKRYV